VVVGDPGQAALQTLVAVDGERTGEHGRAADEEVVAEDADLGVGVGAAACRGVGALLGAGLVGRGRRPAAGTAIRPTALGAVGGLAVVGGVLVGGAVVAGRELVVAEHAAAVAVTGRDLLALGVVGLDHGDGAQRGDEHDGGGET